MREINDIFNIMSANETMKVAKSIRPPRHFWREFWIEDEVCCLFADSNVGKSILAVQIAEHVAKMLKQGESVLYYDFELSKKQFQLRYTSEDGSVFHFNERFIRVELDTDKVREYSAALSLTLDELITHGIEDNINKYNSKVIIVDNISWLTNMKNASSSAGKLMLKLCGLKRKYGISILVLAHTPKRKLNKPITQNDLGGSKSLTNFFDAMFAIGKCISDPSLRYVKQIKVRSGAFMYDSDHVEVCTIEKENSFLGFKHIGYAQEPSLLKPTKEGIKKPTKERKTTTRQKKHERARKSISRVENMASAAFDLLTKEL